MSYLLQNKKRSRNPFIKIIIVLFLCIAIGFFTRNFIVRSLVSVGNGLDYVFSLIIPDSFRGKDEIKMENDQLRKLVTSLQGELVDRQILKEENSNLKFMLGRDVSKEQSIGVLATVIDKSSMTLNDVFVLDAGENLGVRVGDKALFGSIVLGTVIETGPNYSKVDLYSSPHNVFTGVLLKDQIKIEAKGLGGGRFSALVPLGSSASIGDTLILPSISSKVFGVITEIEEKREEGFKALLFTLPVNLNHVHEVILSH